MSEIGSLTITSLLAKATEVLTDGGYRLIPEKPHSAWPSERTRLFEDPYSVVAIVAYETFRDMQQEWIDTQGTFIDFISQHIARGEAKAWDGYLVLLTPGVGSMAEAMEIKYDTRRVRKLVATADDIKTLADLERVLLPLLPLKESAANISVSAFEMLPELLSRKGIDEAVVQVLLSAFSKERPLVEELHKHIISGQ